jgi:hypothetical protein
MMIGGANPKTNLHQPFWRQRRRNGRYVENLPDILSPDHQIFGIKGPQLGSNSA